MELARMKFIEHPLLARLILPWIFWHHKRIWLVLTANPHLAWVQQINSNLQKQWIPKETQLVWKPGRWNKQPTVINSKVTTQKVKWTGQTTMINSLMGLSAHYQEWVPRRTPSRCYFSMGSQLPQHKLISYQTTKMVRKNATMCRMKVMTPWNWKISRKLRMIIITKILWKRWKATQNHL